MTLKQLGHYDKIKTFFEEFTLQIQSSILLHKALLFIFGYVIFSFPMKFIISFMFSTHYGIPFIDIYRDFQENFNIYITLLTLNFVIMSLIPVFIYSYSTSKFHNKKWITISNKLSISFGLLPYGFFVIHITNDPNYSIAWKVSSHSVLAISAIFLFLSAKSMSLFSSKRIIICFFREKK